MNHELANGIARTFPRSMRNVPPPDAAVKKFRHEHRCTDGDAAMNRAYQDSDGIRADWPSCSTIAFTEPINCARPGGGPAIDGRVALADYALPFRRPPIPGGP